MALKLLQAGREPAGQFDGLDTEVLNLKGGEIVTFTSVVATAATDKAAYDVFDGYVNPNKRAVVTATVATSSRPLMLSDDGISGYGTLFGSVVGGTVGQTVSGGTVLGPHTSTGSGKITCWDKPGFYAVSLDACDTAATDGLTPTNASLAAGASLTYIPATASGGQLTPVGSTAANSNTTVVGHFVEFETNGSLVTTPNYLASALAGARTYTYAVFHFDPQY
jgi:hypothetical protein